MTWIWTVVAASVLSGCTYEKVVHDGWDQFRTMEGPGDDDPSGRQASADRSERAPGGRDAYEQSTKEPHVHDLRRFVGVYTLQIGYYDDEYGKDFRAAAERAVVVMREDGHEAYFYHGPHRSMVTIGLFSEKDFVREGVSSVYGPRIREAQKTHPYNLGNGRTLIQKVRGESVGEQPSFIVKVR